MIATARRAAAAALLVAPLLGGSAAAAPRPAAGLVVAQQDMGDDNGGDPAGLVLRIGRLEEQVRSLTGEVEQLQFQNRKLDEALRKMQGDIDFRLQDLEHGAGAAAEPARPAPQKRSEAAAAPTLPATASAADDDPRVVPAGPAARPPEARRSGGDAFDPDLDPTAPGAPKALGTTPASPPLSQRPARQVATEDTRAPLDLMRTTPGATAPRQPDPGLAAPAAPTVIAAPSGAPRDTTAVASLAPGGTREEYDADLGLYKQGQFDGAATGFAAFADKYPKDRLVPDAVYLAGESYARLGRHREAAEQFLKVSTDYGKSPRAPDALLRLGISLNALGAKEQACATYQEVTRRYPAASSDVKAAVDRELKRARCTGNG